MLLQNSYPDGSDVGATVTIVVGAKDGVVGVEIGLFEGVLIHQKQTFRLYPESSLSTWRVWMLEG